MRTDFTGLRRTLLLALGLPVACSGGPVGSTSASATGSTGDSDSSASATSTTTPTSTSASSSTTAGSASASSSSSASTTTATGPDTTTTTGPPPTYECENPTPILQAGTQEPSGFERCDDGLIHRVEPVTCLAPQGVGDCAELGTGCEADADCVDKAYGVCVTSTGGFGGCFCHYGCETDADCEEGTICACAGVVSGHATCIPASCDGMAACAEDELCALGSKPGICDELVAQVACIGPDADCHGDDDCPAQGCTDNDPNLHEHYCFPSQGQWSCDPPGLCEGDCGRPFLVDEEVVTAASRPRSDWLATAGRVAADHHARLAAHWTEAGLMEHASVASFARFTLELLHLGAPPSLIAETRGAMADEIGHARLCFASRHAGRPVGPGPLRTRGSLAAAHERRAIVLGLIREACVVETMAAAEAHEAAAHARDPEAARALSQIASDELRHAALGWRCLRWIITRGDSGLRRFVDRALWSTIADAERELEIAAARADEGSIHDHGVLSTRERVAVRRRALAEIIRGCASVITTTRRAA